MDERKTYSIKEASELIGLPTSTIRYYDKQGLLPFVTRRESGYRQFSEADIDMLRLIECLKRTGMSISDIAEFSRWASMGDASLEQRREMFLERRRAILGQMADLAATLDLVQYKCWYYETALAAGTEAVHAGESYWQSRKDGAARPQSAILQLMMEPETTVVFDVDGVLAVYEFGPAERPGHSACCDEDWETYVRENDPYENARPVAAIQRFVAAKAEIDPSSVFACSVADDYEEPGKRAFVERHYAIPGDNIQMVRKKDDKIAFLEHLAACRHANRRDIVLVEDTTKTLDAADAAGFSTCHVTSFFLY